MKVAFIVPYEGKKVYQQAYDQILSAIETNGGLVLSPEKTDEYGHALATGLPTHDLSRSHYEFIRKSIIDSDVVIVEASYEDFRVGHETTLALIYRKPVLVMAQHLDFGKFIYHPNLTGIHYYPTQVAQIIKDFLDAAISQPQQHPQARIPNTYHQPYKPVRKPKIIAVFGGIYADIFNKVSRIPRENEVSLSSDFKISLGGKATNAAVAMARLGNKVIMLGQLGHDSTAVDLEATLIYESINTDFISRNSAHPTGTVVLAVDKNAQYSTVVHEAANIQIELTHIDNFFKEIDHNTLKLDCLYLTLEAQPAAIDYIIREACKRNIFIFCDAAPHARPLNSQLLSLINIIAPNQIEAEAMTGIVVDDQAAAHQAAMDLTRKGARQTIITLGDQGVYWNSADSNSYCLPALPVKAIDEAGAGDAFRGAFISELLSSKNTINALRFGIRAGAFAVTRFGSYDSMPTHDELAFFKPAKHQPEQP